MNRRNFTYGILAALFAGLTLSVVSFTGGPPAGRSGAPGDQTCQASCHSSFNLNSGPGSANITSNIPAEGYVPGQTYELTFNVSQTGISKFGFQGMVFSPAANTTIGTLATTSDSTQLISGSGRDYVEHTSAGTQKSTWTAEWTAPDAGSGDVEVYAAFVAANNAGGNSGDHVYTAQLSASEQIVSSIEGLAQRDVLRVVDLGPSLEVTFELPKAGEAQLQLINLNGQRMWASSATLNQSTYQTTIDKSTLTAGVYVLSAQTSGRVLTRKIIVR
ncbi:MAG: choice-of-anchor V domain-containing protein [Bacteroidota bacterium]